MILVRCFLVGMVWLQLSGCHMPPPSTLTIYQIRADADTTDEIYQRLIRNYRQRWKLMDQVMAYSPTNYWQSATSRVPVISNWVADALLHSAEKMIGRVPDLVLVSVGNFFQQLPRGNISYRDIYRLFPGHYSWEFRQLPLQVIEQLFDTTIYPKSWGISAGTIIQKRTGQKIKIICQGEEVTSTAKLNVILVRESWGNNNKSYLYQDHSLVAQGNNLHDFIISYCQTFTAAGIPLRISTEKRLLTYD